MKVVCLVVLVGVLGLNSMDIENLPIGPTPQGYANPDQISRQKKIAELLMMGSGQQQRPTHPMQLAGNLANSAVGNMQLNQANALDRSSDLQDAGSFVGGTQGADPVKNEASRFALLAQKYSGKPLGVAVSDWKKGEGGAPYEQFITGRTGLDPSTPITPELLKSPQGIALAKAMADWDAGGRAPITGQQMLQAQQMAFGGPQAAAGEGAQGAGPAAAAFSGEPADGGGNAMEGIVNALQAPKTGGPPVPGGPVTRAPLPGSAESGNGIPPGVLPHRIPMSREALINTLASRRLDPSVKNTALQLYLEQSQPMQMKVPGGTMNISPSGQTWVVPELFQGTMEAGGAKMPVGFTYPWDPKNPNAIKQEFAPSGMGGAPGGGPLGTAPPSGQPQTAQNSIIPPQMQGLADFSNQQKRIQEFNTEDLKNAYTKVKESTDLGLQAERSVPQLKQLRHMIEDKRLQQSIGSDIVLDWNRIKAFAGSKGGERATALMQAFDKMVSGQIVSDLKTQLQGTGQIRVKEIELVEKASASRYNTREANRAILELMIKSNEQMAGLGEATANYLAEHKHNASTAGLIQAKMEWLKKHPMLNEKEIADYHKKFDADPRYPEDLGEGEGSKGKNFRNPQPALPTTPPPSPTELELRRRGLIK